MARRSMKDDPKLPQQPSNEFLEALKENLAMLSEHYRQPISELSTLVYLEDLSHLTVEELNAACKRARQQSEFLPVSALILKAANSLKWAEECRLARELEDRECNHIDNREDKSRGNATRWLGPPAIDYAALETPEEKKEREERLASFNKLLVETINKTSVPPPPQDPPPPPPPKPLPQPSRSLEEQLAELRKRGFLQ